MKIGLCMIVKNEEHIIRESLTCTLPLIDTYCIVDTGSTDNTIQVIKDFYADKGISGEVHQREWINFGKNRSEALQLCDDKMDYCLVIDADDLMTFPANGKQWLHNFLEEKKPNALTMSIRQGDLDYDRAQIFKANDNWGYVGVLHEYPSNHKQNNTILRLPPDFWMESRRLGGRNKTGDKLKRDIEVLEQGIKDEPDNDRYYFYLAQSYRDAGIFDKAIENYKKRFHMGRWVEEAWFAAYQVGRCYFYLKNFLKFEYWMQRAFLFRPIRAEPIYELAKFFRETAQFQKAKHYIDIGLKLSYPKDDVLFIEKFPNEAGFLYESTIVDYYVNPDKKVGLRHSFEYLLKRNDHVQNVISNLKFYTSPISNDYEKLNIPNVFGDEFRASAISIIEYPFANARFVNYQIQGDGSYKTPNGIVQTKNAYLNLETGECISAIEEPTPLFESEIKGIEDLRLYRNNSGELCFTSTSYKQYIPNCISIVAGKYDYNNRCLKEYRGIHSPTGNGCEKNWVNIPNSEEFIYSWHPLRIGKIVDDKFVFTQGFTTPPLFSHFRGSARPLKVGNKWLTLVHFVEYCTPRKYYHCFVETDENFKPTRVSLPFYFKHNAIEFCISTRLVNSHFIDCYPSFNDCNPHRVRVEISKLDWIPL